jgi:predicted DNA binding protein/GAF domain-containing protein
MSTIAPADALAVFEAQERPGTPLTAPEVADALGCARRTAYEKLVDLSERGLLATKKVGARGRIWWVPSPADADGTRDAPGDRTDPDKTRVRTLRELHDASRQLMRADTRERVCEVAVEAAQRILGLPLSGLWLYASEQDRLEPAAWTERGVEEFGDPPAFPLGESLVGRIFRDGTYRAYDDITAEAEDAVYDPETRVRSELVFPLGSHGVLNASSVEVGAFDEVDVSLGRILAANVETALDRADQLETRRARRRELERQRDELATLNQINALVEDTIGALVGAATRDEIEATVCERLAGSTFYTDASIVERGSTPSEFVVRSGSSDESAFLPDDEAAIRSPNAVATAIEERTVQVVPTPEETDRPADGARSDVAAGAGARLVVPLVHADTVFGALVVRATGPDAFSDREQAAFETLGRVVGFVINATNNRLLLLGNTAVELEVALGSSDSDAWFLSAADRIDGAIEIEGVVPTDGGALIEYVTVTDVPDGVAPGALRDVPAIRDVRVLTDDGDRWVLECAVRDGDADLGAMLAYGATVRSARAADGVGTVTIRFPSTASPRDAMAVVRESFPTAELVAKRVVDVSDRSVATIRQRIADRLTDKQSTALRAAFLAGYYDYPRETTAEELAGSLDIASSTLYQHLQAAHRKLLGTVFADIST